MKKAEGINLKNGTLVSCVGSTLHLIGVVEYNNEFGNYIFHNKTPHTRFQSWSINNWNYYSVITESEFMMFMLENA